MEKSQGTSFIPKSPVRAPQKVRGKKRVFIFTYITFVFFFGTLLATAGIFIWSVTIDNQLDVQKNNLAIERESFDNAQLEKVRELEARMNIAFGLLDAHVSVHSIFEALEEATLRSIQITGFEYIKDINNTLILTMEVNASNFNSSLYQREVFSKDSILAGATISEVIFTDSVSSGNILLSSQEAVTYQITKELSTSEIPYVPNAFTQSFTDTADFATTDDSFVEFSLEDDALEEDVFINE